MNDNLIKGNFNNNPPVQPRKIKLSDTTEVLCTNCSHNVFSVGAMFRKVSALLTSTGNPQLIPIEIVYCVKCGTAEQHHIPDELKSQIVK